MRHRHKHFVPQIQRVLIECIKSTVNNNHVQAKDIVAAKIRYTVVALKYTIYLCKLEMNDRNGDDIKILTFSASGSGKPPLSTLPSQVLSNQ